MKKYFKTYLRLLLLIPVFLTLASPAESGTQAYDRAFSKSSSGSALTVLEEEKASPCRKLQITGQGAICESVFGFVAELNFPEVNMAKVISGEEFLPKTEKEFTEMEEIIGGKSFQNISLVLRWEPATPDFLQAYITSYLPEWNGRAPYRLFWETHYEVCMPEGCTDYWSTVSGKGEILPADVEGLPSDLAADINYNGVPVAFWNSHVNQ